jgi:hypothetical protein
MLLTAAAVPVLAPARQRGEEQIRPEVIATDSRRIKVSKCCVSKMVTGMTMKTGCWCMFVAKQVYVDPTLCELQYHCWNHVTTASKAAQGTAFDGFRHSLGGRLTTKTMKWIESMNW